jgi:hypothetical protein
MILSVYKSRFQLFVSRFQGIKFSRFVQVSGSRSFQETRFRFSWNLVFRDLKFQVFKVLRFLGIEVCGFQRFKFLKFF